MIRLIENFSSMFWFLMDVFWSCGLGTLAGVMIFPTVFSNMLMFKHSKKRSDLLVCIATNSWVLMNVCWMMPDITTAAWAENVFFCRWIFLVIASLAMVVIMFTDFNNLRNIKRFRINN